MKKKNKIECYCEKCGIFIDSYKEGEELVLCSECADSYQKKMKKAGDKNKEQIGIWEFLTYFLVFLVNPMGWMGIISIGIAIAFICMVFVK